MFIAPIACIAAGCLDFPIITGDINFRTFFPEKPAIQRAACYKNGVFHKQCPIEEKERNRVHTRSSLLE
jgi:hypothetical protein